MSLAYIPWKTPKLQNMVIYPFLKIDFSHFFVFSNVLDTIKFNEKNIPTENEIE